MRCGWPVVLWATAACSQVRVEPAINQRIATLVLPSELVRLYGAVTAAPPPSCCIHRVRQLKVHSLITFEYLKTFNRGDTKYHGGLRSRELCQAPIFASVIFSLAGVVGESLSFSTLQKMQRWLRPDSNARLEATYRHSLIRRRARNDHGHHGRPKNS